MKPSRRDANQPVPSHIPTLAQTTTVTALAAATAPIAAAAAGPESLDEWIAALKSHDDNVRGAAWPKAEHWGAAAVRPLIETMADSDAEVVRAAKRALWRIVHHSGRPRAVTERNAVVAGLLTGLGSGPTPVRRELLWMLSEIGDGHAVATIAPLLGHVELREDARSALQRIPGSQATAALKAARVSAPTEFQTALTAALRARGVKD